MNILERFERGRGFLYKFVEYVQGCNIHLYCTEYSIVVRIRMYVHVQYLKQDMYITVRSTYITYIIFLNRRIFILS